LPDGDHRGGDRYLEEREGHAKWQQVQEAASLHGFGYQEEAAERETQVEGSVDRGPQQKRSRKLPASTFQPDKKQRSMDWNQITSVKGAAPSWYSPKAENINQVVTDLAVFEQARSSDNISVLERGWIGSCAQVKHNLIVRLPPQGNVGTFKWYRVLHHYASSGVLAWPGRLRSVGPSGHRHIFEHDRKVDEPSIVALVDGEVEAYAFQWRSMPWQTMYLPASECRVAQLKAICNGKPMPLVEVMADNAFFIMGIPDIVQWSSLRLIVIGKGISLVDALVTSLMGILKCTLAQAIDRIAIRLGTLDEGSYWCQELLGIDDAVDVVERSDAKLIAQEQDGAANQAASTAQFRKDFRKRAWDARALAEPAPKGKGRGKARLDTREKFPVAVPQQEASRYKPPGCSIWRGWTREEWCGHCPPRKRLVSKDEDYESEYAAMRDVLRRLWIQHLDVKGLPSSSCPHRDLLTVDDAKTLDELQ
jgi:hypothetical protein